MINRSEAQSVLREIKYWSKRNGYCLRETIKETEIINFILDCWNNKHLTDKEIRGEVKTKYLSKVNIDQIGYF